MKEKIKKFTQKINKNGDFRSMSHHQSHTLPFYIERDCDPSIQD